MIRITKPVQAPRILRKRGARATKELCDLFDEDREAYLSGAKVFKFNSKIYGAKSVKNALKKAQHDKCCFCESKVTHVAYGDVEHFRPKAGFRQRADDDLGRPGYYWLAYAWENLFFSCQLCNQRFKGNLFPLENPTGRSRTHRDNIQQERPLFLDPAENDPANHIGFRGEIAYPKRNSRRARTSIEALGLNREAIVERRRDRLADVTEHMENRSVLVEAINMLAPLDTPDRPNVKEALREMRARLNGIKRHLSRSVEPTAEYSSMCRAAIPATMR